jgi:hypothetical protein
MDCVFIRYVYNSSAYWLLIHKSIIEDIHPNTIMESRNVIFFEEVFSWKEVWENHSLRNNWG